MASIQRKKPSHSEAPAAAQSSASPPLGPALSPSTESATLDHEASQSIDLSRQAAAEESLEKTFRDLGIADPLCEACAKLSYTAPTPIQTRSIPPALAGRDVIGLAETGSGKTAAFALPILQSLLDASSSGAGSRHLSALVLAPTRELAVQIRDSFAALGSLIGVRCAVIVGGMDMVAQAIELGKKPHVVVATPGRLLDHLEKTKGFSLQRTLRHLVIDEADRLLDLDFGPVLDKILKFLPRDGRQTSLFSATMSSKVESLQRASLRDPVRVSVVAAAADRLHTVASLRQSYLFIPLVHKDTYLIYLLDTLPSTNSTIIFARTVNATQRLAILLRSLGFSAVPIHGQLSQSSRLASLSKFRSRARSVLVATDVAARGLDIPAVDCVINYDLPQDSKTYVHRVGRTARAGRPGVALSLVTQYDLEVWLRIEAALGGKKLDEYPTDKDEVMVFKERVEEASRDAKSEMRTLMESGGSRGGFGTRGRGRSRVVRRGRDEMDREEG